MFADVAGAVSGSTLYSPNVKSSGPVTFDERHVRCHVEGGRARESVAVDHDALRILVPARNAAIDHALKSDPAAPAERALDARLAHRPRHARQHGEDFTELVGRRDRDERVGVHAHALEALELIGVARRVRDGRGQRDRRRQRRCRSSRPYITGQRAFELRQLEELGRRAARGDRITDRDRGRADVNTKSPCDVAGFESASSGSLDEETVVLARGDDAGRLDVQAGMRRSARRLPGSRGSPTT